MRILEVIEGLGPGGAQRFVVDLSNELTLTNDVAIGTFVERKGSDFYVQDLSPKVKRLNFNFRPNFLLKIRQMISVFKMIAKFKPDVLHVHDRAFVPCIIPSLLYPGIRFYYTVHNVANKDAGEGIGSRLRKYFLKRTIKPIAISKYCEGTFGKFYGYKPFSVIENGCRPLSKTNEYDKVEKEIRLLKKTQNTKVFLNIARFFEQKNHELLINTFNSIIEEGHDVLLLIIGSSPDRKRKEYLESLVSDRTRIIFLGTKHNVQDYLFATEYFCLSSSWEGLPITILEAGLCGSYTISTPVGGVRDVIDNDTIGILSADLSLNSYKDAVRKALEYTPNFDDIRNYFTRKYTMKICAQKYINAFNKDDVSLF